ncbi:NACHT domain-containing NTPase [Streptomyces sp. NEAU-YJ-81]|uniref:NACHT domain-containing protein n=1 Tax=Streptomyces sp. NEAU-YJ-81 TaxID=2820288 RepID=UPI001ABCC272|nr:NACHT domain-containing protein [Streptomyces sp. NEAU-YJ-81]MBO3675819.1 NACHT domain-containing protein [Streptomyces sp. NEAU-YJ-81]
MQGEPVARNEFSGTAHTVIQAHTIYGGIHFNDGRRPVTGLRLAGQLLLAGCSVAVGASLFVLRARDDGDASALPGSMLGPAAMALCTFGVWLAVRAILRHRRSRVLWGDLSGPELNAAADQLASAVREQLGREERLRRLQDPAPIPVRWDTARQDLIDHWANVTGGGPVDLGGRFEEIADVLDRVPSGRLVVLGPAGTGKSVLMVRLALDRLERRAPGERIPVILPLASWRPQAQPDLWEWAAELLGTRYASLATGTASARDIARELLRTGRLLPILDGFDELPAAVRPQALRTLNGTLDRAAQIVLTSREGEYREAAGEARVLTGAAAVSVRPLTLADLTAYLSRTAAPSPSVGGRPHHSSWRQVLDPRTTDPARAARARALGEALATPLMVSLARKAYSDTGRNPAELLDPSRFPDSAAIEAHLLDQFVPATYDASLAAASPGRRWDAEDAHRWLTFLARHARTLGTPEVTWWSLPRALPWPVRHAAVIAAMAMGLVALTPTGYSRPVEGPLGMGSPPLFAVAALFGVIAVIDDAVDTPQPRTLTARGRIPLLLRRTTAVVPFAVFVVMAATAADLRSSLYAVVPLVLLVGGAVWQDTADHALARSPRALLRSDRRTVLALPGTRAFADSRHACAAALCLLSPLALFLSQQLTTYYPPGVTPPAHSEKLVTGGDWLLVCLASAVALLLYGFAFSAWGKFGVARLWLAATGRLPWHLMEFLEDACQRGALRQSGGVLSFRHRTLQDRLAPPRSSPPAPVPTPDAPSPWQVLVPALPPLVLCLMLPGLVISLSTPDDERYRSVPEACELVDERLAARVIPRPESTTREPFRNGQSRCDWATDGEMVPSIYLVVTIGQAEAGQSAVQEAVMVFRSADTISGEHGSGRRSPLELGQEAVWRRFDSGGQVLVRQDNIVLNLGMYGVGPATEARLPAYAEEVLHRALTRARRGG